MGVALLPILVCVLALLLDRWLGEPKRWHPLVAFGNSAEWLERQINNQPRTAANIYTKWRGALAVLAALLLPLLAVGMVQLKLGAVLPKLAFETLLLYGAIGWQSMKQHALAVHTPLVGGDLRNAKQNLAMIVSRQTADMTESEVIGATLESVLENGHDSVFASLFWFAVLGPFGAVLHRLVNTLDAMWGYKNSRFSHFGFAAARLDDVLGAIPARLTAICYALVGQTTPALQAWRRQMGKHKSPNAGLVMATGAGALGCKIGGAAIYDGIRQDKPYLGVGEGAIAADIPRALGLVENSIIGGLVLLSLVLLARHFFI